MVRPPHSNAIQRKHFNMVKGIILDLDGTLYLGQAEIPGASGFVRRMHAKGIRCLFVTNRANRTAAQICAQLRSYGIEGDESDVITSAHATAHALRNSSAYVVGEAALVEALEAEGVTVTDRDPANVVVGFDRGFTYAKLKTACRLIARGARFVATNPDHCLKIDGACDPGTGSIVAAVQVGSDTEPVVIGKPETALVEMSLEVLAAAPDDVLMVGDNLDTDILAGARAGVPTVLILTGVSSRDDAATADPAPTWVVEDYEELTGLVESRSA